MDVAGAHRVRVVRQVHGHLVARHHGDRNGGACAAPLAGQPHDPRPLPHLVQPIAEAHARIRLVGGRQLIRRALPHQRPRHACLRRRTALPPARPPRRAGGRRAHLRDAREVRGERLAALIGRHEPRRHAHPRLDGLGRHHQPHRARPDRTHSREQRVRDAGGSGQVRRDDRPTSVRGRAANGGVQHGGVQDGGVPRGEWGHSAVRRHRQV
mmetsp:Transcript_36064/g.89756  ORF Transcript_36064/g.89756 Transcript_36064/m.89756 type:complete len:211 (-) Transcript_36064:1849-2481(-)